MSTLCIAKNTVGITCSCQIPLETNTDMPVLEANPYRQDLL